MSIGGACGRKKGEKIYDLDSWRHTATLLTYLLHGAESFLRR